MRFSILRKRRPDPDDHPTSRLVDRLLREAAEAGASDLHVAPAGDDGGATRLRIDGHFREGEKLDAELYPRVIARLKVLAGLAAFRTGEPQEGRIRLETNRGPADLRVSTVPVVGGEKAVVRFFDLADEPRTIGELGLSGKVESALRGLLELPPGVVFVVGPCSSGKTTTLYALARELIASRGEWTNVVSVEDPVEQRVEGMAQTEVDARRGLDFPKALSSLLRQDPEVILVGETRDPETARIAVEAGFTGHRVLTSMHVGRPEEVPRRLALMGVPEYLVAEAMRGAMAQRLLRRACGECGVEGCDLCAGTGYRGRFAIGEVARFSGGVAEAVTTGLEGDAAEHMVRGDTTEAELRRVLGAGEETS